MDKVVGDWNCVLALCIARMLEDGVRRETAEYDALIPYAKS